MITVPKLEMHLADACNLQCTGCTHYSEFNALGAFAFTRYRDDFRFLDVSVESVTWQPCRVFWSRRPPGGQQRQEIASLLG